MFSARFSEHAFKIHNLQTPTHWVTHRLEYPEPFLWWSCVTVCVCAYMCVCVTHAHVCVCACACHSASVCVTVHMTVTVYVQVCMCMHRECHVFL